MQWKTSPVLILHRTRIVLDKTLQSVLYSWMRVLRAVSSLHRLSNHLFLAWLFLLLVSSVQDIIPLLQSQLGFRFALFQHVHPAIQYLLSSFLTCTLISEESPDRPASKDEIGTTPAGFWSIYPSAIEFSQLSYTRMGRFAYHMQISTDV